MAVLMEMEMQVTPDQYDAVDAALDPQGNPPDGLIAHTARFDGDTLKILDVWESADAFSAFAESRPWADDRRDARRRRAGRPAAQLQQSCTTPTTRRASDPELGRHAF
jgi:hypothetical protein